MQGLTTPRSDATGGMTHGLALTHPCKAPTLPFLMSLRGCDSRCHGFIFYMAVCAFVRKGKRDMYVSVARNRASFPHDMFVF